MRAKYLMIPTSRPRQPRRRPSAGSDLPAGRWRGNSRSLARKTTKKAARKRAAGELCVGTTRPCVSTRSDLARPPEGRETQLPVLLATGTPSGRARLTKAMKAFYSCNDKSTYQQAIQRLRSWAAAHAANFERLATTAKRHKPAAAGAALAADWLSCRARRRGVAALPDDAARKAYRAAVLADQRYAKKRFFPETPRRARATKKALLELVNNDCDLPGASRSEISIGLQRWCTEGAWGMCSGCCMLQTRPLRPQDLHAKVHNPTVPHSACRAHYPHKVHAQRTFRRLYADCPPRWYTPFAQ